MTIKRIGLISDTHDNVNNVLKAVDVFNELDLSFIIHCGDIVAPATIKFFKCQEIRFIRGNCDGDIENIKKIAESLGHRFIGDNLILGVFDKKLVAYHGTDKKRLEGLIKSQKYDYVLHGHTHKKRDEMIGKTRVINPGAHYYCTENTIAILEIKEGVKNTEDALRFISLE